jgi:hypothetical protein
MSTIFINTDINAPGCPCEICLTGSKRSILVQFDQDYCGFARSFGWDISKVTGPVPDDPYEGEMDFADLVAATAVLRYEKQCECEHRRTDGTVDCPDCGLGASVFMSEAREFLEGNDGLEAEDPGYFDEAEA